jgi:hypothetical protein
MDLNTFWLGWRRDILRLVALCLAALVVGLLINGAVHRAGRGVASLLPGGALQGLSGDFDSDTAVGSRTIGAAWTYRARIPPGQWVWVRDVRGSVTVEAARGDSLEVVAVKSYRHADPESVHLVAVPTKDGVAICALWGSRDSRCGPGDDYKQGRLHRNDVGVQFTVRLPRGVRIGVTTVSGSVRVSGATAPIIAGTVDGAVDAETAKGPVTAYTVNGSVHASMRGFADTGAVKLTTVNGAVTVALPARLDARVDANTVNGSIDSDFPLTTSGKFVAHHAEGTFGAGTRRIALNVVNGSIRLKKHMVPR